MRINYKEPYWIKFDWETESHHDNQYVTNFDKTEKKELKEFLFNYEYILTCNFKIEPEYKIDEISMVFGKPGKNLGLSYNPKSKIIAFEFWSKGENEDKFNFLHFQTVNLWDVQQGLTISIVKCENKFSLYNNFILDNTLDFKNDLIDDYRDSPLFIGCSMPQGDLENRRYYGEVEINHLSLIKKTSDINIAKDMYQSDVSKLVSKKYYNDILFYYDFKNINNIGIVYDESRNNHFLEKVPKKFIL